LESQLNIDIDASLIEGIAFTSNIIFAPTNKVFTAGLQIPDFRKE
jgi:hypothetical protein